MLRTVIVNLRSDQTVGLRGVLWRTRGAWLILRKVNALRGAAPPTLVDGEVLVHRSNVAFIQVLDDRQ